MVRKKANKDELIERVRKVKRFLKAKGIKRDVFIDNTFGSMYDSEHTRIINLWQVKITDESFTEKLEHFAEYKTSQLRTSVEFERFIAFARWFTALGGKPLTVDDIEKCYPKFTIKNDKDGI
jgi:hypothetical protein